MRIGVISDTHGLVRDEALAALAGSDLVVHAGDIGKPEVLAALREIAPVVAVRGNVDSAPWSRAVPRREVVEAEGALLYVLHDLADIDLDPQGCFDAVVCGHSHRPMNEVRGGVLYFNPGSAGPRRFRLPIAVGRITVAGGRIAGEIVELPVDPSPDA